MKKIVALCFLVCSFTFLKASHNRAGEILYKRIAPFTKVVGSVTVEVYTYSITVIRYTGDGPAVADRCGDTIYFGDGAWIRAPRINGAGTCGCGSINNAPVGCGEIIVNAQGYIVKKNVYTAIHTYPGSGTYVIWSSDPTRDQGIHNIPNSVNRYFYIETKIIISPFMGGNSSPILCNPPTDYGRVGSCVYINCAAYDLDGDSLSYELTACKYEYGDVPGYFFPETGTNGTFSINAVTGLLTWCSPQFSGTYGIAIMVKEWRKNSCNSQSILLGYVIRDFEVTIQTTPLSSYTASAISDICVKAGTAVHKTMQITAANTSLSLLGEIKTFTSNPGSITPQNVSGTQTVNFNWQTKCSQARKMPYDIYIVANVSNYYMQKEYTQFRVTLLPPSPSMLTPFIDTGIVILNWIPLDTCLPSLTGYSIYRKTGNNSWSPNSCEHGVPANSGFVLIGNAPANAASFTDDDLSLILNGTSAHYIVTPHTSDCLEGIADNAQTVTLVVGIKENELNQEFQIYPNPFNEDIEINLGEKNYKQIEISVFAIDGKLVFKGQNLNNESKFQLTLKSLNAGIYLIRVATESGVAYKKVVKN
ncbi:T9SS type A sorting domain-containing protein [Aurantibacillus circumpalustris]|uniref:T9SS type A sorting domain-containing protein n=1 Tax=Aurantibacillus circumpalustris TaxID=3036359 RepID=UPI00295BE01D|nr:T9SS type A sorting domain-containing protein [Aurantibacillus circumpalustris]